MPKIPIAPLIATLALAVGMAATRDPAAAQVPSGAPRVFLDCRSPECDQTYYRTEIPWVSWVRDQADADVYVIMTSQQTGAGGREYLLDLEGRGTNQDFAYGARYRSSPTDTQRESLDGIALTLGLALAQFATQAGYRDLVEVAPLRTAEEGFTEGAPSGLVAADEVSDPLNLWVFRVRSNGI
jgi:hypothetical protein